MLDLELDTLVFLERPKATAADLEKWTKTSFDPSSGVIKPKPLSPLNHFTVPCAIYLLLSFRADVQKIRAHSNRIDDGQRIIRAQHGAALQQEQRGAGLVNGALERGGDRRSQPWVYTGEPGKVDC